MTPEELEYREGLRSSGVVVRLDVASSFKSSLSRALDALEQSSDQAVATSVRLGRGFEADKGDLLVLPPDRDTIQKVLDATLAVSVDAKLDISTRIMAKDLAIRIGKFSEVPVDVPTGESCVRSPCGPPKDPKVERREILAALARVGTPKTKQRVFLRSVKRGDEVENFIEHESTRTVHRPYGRLTVACGLGVDSAAILVGLAQEYAASGDDHWKPELITFADTGGEHPETYAFLAHLNAYLKKVGFPAVTVVAWATEMQGGDDRGGWGTGVTLEINCLNNHQVPSISVGGHSCSNKFKIQPQQSYLKRTFAGQLAAGESIVRAIGYDATEEARLVSGGTYVSRKEEEDTSFAAWYPLIEWGWDRSRCIAEIAVAFGSPQAPAWNLVPRKSSCFFCGAMTPEEIVMLAEAGHKDLLKRAILMEQVALMNWSHQGPPDNFVGLGRQFSWTDFALANLDRLNPRQRVVIEGGVLREDRGGRWRSIHLGPPSECPVEILPNDRVYQPSGLFPLLTVREIESVKETARRWIKVSPKSSGDPTKDLAFTREAMALPAYRDVLGFRGTDSMTWDRMEDLVGLWERRADRGDDRAATVLKGLSSLSKKLYGGRRLPVL